MDDRSESSGRPASPGVDRTLTVLEHLVETDEELTLTALAKVTNISLATCASIVYTLEQRGYATRRVVGRSHFWRPTLRLYGLASQLVRDADLSRVATSEMRTLADQLGMPVHMGVLDGYSVVYVAKAATPGFVQFDTYSGKIAPFNLTALGRAIAAYLEPDALEPLLTKLTPGRGPNAPKGGRKAFLALLDDVRARGYATEEEEEQAEISCVAAPFFGIDGQVAGALGVTGFARDLTTDRMRIAASGLVELATEVSRRLGCPAESLPTALPAS